VTLLSDNDIIYKLAACDMLDEALVVLGVTYTDVYVLPTAKYKFGITQNPGRAEAQYGRDVVVRIRNFLANVRELEVVGPPEELQLLGRATLQRSRMCSPHSPVTSMRSAPLPLMCSSNPCKLSAYEIFAIPYGTAVSNRGYTPPLGCLA